MGEGGGERVDWLVEPFSKREMDEGRKEGWGGSGRPRLRVLSPSPPENKRWMREGGREVTG